MVVVPGIFLRGRRLVVEVVPSEFHAGCLAPWRKIWGMFRRSAWKITSSKNSVKVGNALQPFSCCRVCTFVDHLVRNQPGSFSTKACNLEGCLNILRLCKWFIAISIWCKKSLNSRRPCASVLEILGQLESLFSKSVAVIQGRPKRDFNFFLASIYAISGLALTVYWSCSATFFTFPSKCWYKKYSFCWALIGAELIRASNAVSQTKNSVSVSSLVKMSGLAWGSRCRCVALAEPAAIWKTLSELEEEWFWLSGGGLDFISW